MSIIHSHILYIVSIEMKINLQQWGILGEQLWVYRGYSVNFKRKGEHWEKQGRGMYLMS